VKSSANHTTYIIESLICLSFRFYFQLKSSHLFIKILITSLVSTAQQWHYQMCLHPCHQKSFPLNPCHDIYYFTINTTSLFQNQAPTWWKTPLMGPSFPTGHKPAPKEMRKPGCNGGVCYCNTGNYCNDRHKYTSEDGHCPEELEHHKWDVRCKKKSKRGV
jgi:hypothetical protein